MKNTAILLVVTLFAGTIFAQKPKTEGLTQSEVVQKTQRELDAKEAALRKTTDEEAKKTHEAHKAAIREQHEKFLLEHSDMKPEQKQWFLALWAQQEADFDRQFANFAGDLKDGQELTDSWAHHNTEEAVRKMQAEEKANAAKKSAGKKRPQAPSPSPSSSARPAPSASDTVSPPNPAAQAAIPAPDPESVPAPTPSTPRAQALARLHKEKQAHRAECVASQYETLKRQHEEEKQQLRNSYEETLRKNPGMNAKEKEVYSRHIERLATESDIKFQEKLAFRKRTNGTAEVRFRQMEAAAVARLEARELKGAAEGFQAPGPEETK